MVSREPVLLFSASLGCVTDAPPQRLPVMLGSWSLLSLQLQLAGMCTNIPVTDKRA